MLSVKAALLSVIIPVYNVEPYLEQCLDSVINQTYKNLEIICINDGSTDNSLKILEKYHKKDSRIKLINQKNKGTAAARNAGLDIATGEYITFVDSDDYLELKAYEKAMKVMLKNPHVDIAEFRVNVFSEDNDPVNINRTNDHMKYLDDVFKSKIHNVVVWNKIFKAEMIKKMNIRFIDELEYADNFFSHAATMSSKNSAFINVPLYNYRVCSSSVSTSQAKSNNPLAMHVYYNYDALVEFAKKHKVLEKYKKSIYSRYINRIKCFCNDKKRMSEAIDHWDKKILDSECPDNLKTEYLKKRKEIKQAVNL